MTTHCPSCGKLVTIGQRIGTTIACGLTGAVLGAGATKNPIAGLLCFFVGLFVGRAIDTYLETHCPHCGALLRIAESLLE